jgi:hypothetical protein
MKGSSGGCREGVRNRHCLKWQADGQNSAVPDTDAIGGPAQPRRNWRQIKGPHASAGDF